MEGRRGEQRHLERGTRDAGLAWQGEIRKEGQLAGKVMTQAGQCDADSLAIARRPFPSSFRYQQSRAPRQAETGGREGRCAERTLWLLAVGCLT